MGFKAVDHFFKINRTLWDETPATRFSLGIIRIYENHAFWNRLIYESHCVSEYSMGLTYWEFDSTGKIIYGGIDNE